MRKSFEKIFTIVMLFYTTSALSSLIGGSVDPLARAEGNPIAIGIQVALYSVAAFFIATRWQPFLHGALKVKWIGLLLAIAVASSAWSQDPALSLRRSTLLIATTAFGIYFATRFDMSEQLRLLAWTLGIAVCLSFAFGVFFPEYAIDSAAHTGDWQGIFSQKNGLARVMVLSGLVYLFVRPGFHRGLRWMGILGSLGLLILSGSLSGMIIVLIILSTIPLLTLFRTKLSFLVPVGLSLLVLLGAALHFLTPMLPDLFDIVNRSSSLTGRTDIWDAVLISISKRPLLGYGFEGFWLGMKGESANILLSVRWAASHGHNGFLDLWLDLGAVGVATFVAGYLLLWRRALKNLRHSLDWTSVWLCVFLTFTLLYNLTESALVKENTIFWVLYTSTAVNLFLRKSSIAAQGADVASYELEPNPDYLS